MVPPPATRSQGHPPKHPELEGPLPTLEAPLPTLGLPLPTLKAPLPSSEVPQESIVPQEPAEPAGPALTLESLLTAHLRSVSRSYGLLIDRRNSFTGRKGDLQTVWRTVWKRVWRAVWEEWEEVSYVFQLAPYCRTTTKRPPAGIEPARGTQS
jgi:hypothetical protein